jgi:hypothetical protein
MLWRHFHRFILWLPVAAGTFYGAILAIAGQAASTNSIASAFLDEQLSMLRAMTNAALFPLWCALVAGVWLAAFSYSGHRADKMEKKPDLADLADILKQLIPPPVTNASVQAIFPPSVTVSPPEATATGDTLEATGRLFPLGLFVADVVVSAAKLERDRCLEIAIKAFNGTGVPLILVDKIEGRLRGAKGTLSGALPLPPPIPLPGVTSYPVDAGAEFLVAVRQSVPDKTAREYLKQLEDGQITLDLRALNIHMAAADDPENRSRLPLWDAVTLRRRNDIATGRVTIMPVESTRVSVTPSASVKLTVTRADGSTEEGNA